MQSMEPVKVVVRYMDGLIIKGYTQDFSPNKSSFHLYKDFDGTPDKQPTTVDAEGLKAIFFVKSFLGNSSYNERKTLDQGDKLTGRKVEMVFKDGETMQGTVLGYNPQRPGFFVFPIDSKGNNLRIFVVAQALRKFRFL
jgi:hypothetical protein